MNTISVTSLFGHYEVKFISDIKATIERIVQENPSHLLIDSKIMNMYGDMFGNANKFTSKKTIAVFERNKSLDTVQSYIRFLLRHHVKKNHMVIVVGGGLVQDIGSFTSHILLRGIRWIFIPTTLLSMADSCIGSKSGINVGKYKNQVGSFHPPHAIYIDPQFLQTLPRDMILDGNGEIIKHAIISGGKTYDYLTKHLSNIQTNTTAARDVIFQSLLVKKKIVEEDEFDKGIRRLLNYGHTFGHAIEGYTKNSVPHGIAVTMGMDMANYISVQRGLLPQKEYKRMSGLLHQNIPIAKFPIKNIDTYMDFLSHDKKVIGNEVHALLCRGIGHVESIPVKLDKKLKGDVKAYVIAYPEIRSRALKNYAIKYKIAS